MALRDSYACSTPNLLNIVFLAALFRWKKWGFWGLLGTHAALVVIGLASGVGLTEALSVPTSLVILYSTLQMGDRTGWSQLE